MARPSDSVATRPVVIIPDWPTQRLGSTIKQLFRSRDEKKMQGHPGVGETPLSIRQMFGIPALFEGEGECSKKGVFNQGGFPFTLAMESLEIESHSEDWVASVRV